MSAARKICDDPAAGAWLAAGVTAQLYDGPFIFGG